MGTVVFVLHSRISPEDPVVTACAAVLNRRGHLVEIPGPTVTEGWNSGTDLVVTFGGDGTYLRAARLAAPAGIPLLPVNLGRLGFNALVDVGGAEAAMAAWSEGATEIETRSVLNVEVEGARGIAINEVAVLKDPTANIIEVDAHVDGVHAGTFHADGALVATPSGSTAYSASAGGPLLDPRTDCMILLPLAAHNLASRPLVVPGMSRVELSVGEPTRLVLDGAVTQPLDAGTSVTCALDGPVKVMLVRIPGERGFYSQLRDKMNWGRPLLRGARG